MSDRDPNTGKFVRGNRANPGGRPKAAISLEALTSCVSEDELRLMVRKLVELSLAGDLKAMEMLLDRIYGKPQQRTELTGMDGAPLLKGYIGISPDDWDDDKQ